MTLCSTAWLIYRHRLAWYDPVGQTYIIAILALLPFYSACTLVSILLPRQFIYFDAARELYEAFVLYAFFLLVHHLFYQRALLYLDDDPSSSSFTSPHALEFAQRYKWSPEHVDESSASLFALGEPVRPCSCWCVWLEIRPTPLKLRLCKIAVAQYFPVRLLYSFVAIVLQNAGKLHHRSLDPQHPYLWMSIVINISITVAVAALLLFITLVNDVIHMHDPLLKLGSLKAVVIVIFWQSILFSLLTYVGVVPFDLFDPAAASENEVVGMINNCLICLELAVLSIYNWHVFRWNERQVTSFIVSHTTLDPSLRGLADGPRSAGGSDREREPEREAEK
jgi:Organic solute transporter Ostalpha